MKINAIQQQIFKQNNVEAKNIVSMEFSNEKKEKPYGKIVGYSLGGVIGAAVGALHGIFKKIENPKLEIGCKIEPATKDQVRLRIREHSKNDKRLRVAILMKLDKYLTHKDLLAGDWKIVPPNNIIENVPKVIQELIPDILPGKEEKIIPISEIKILSCFKKVVDPAEANILEKLSKNKTLKKAVDYYNKCDDIIKPINPKLLKDLYYNKQLVLKGSVLGVLTSLLIAFGLDKTIKKIKENKQAKIENANTENK